MNSSCSREGCDSRAVCRGKCQKHYDQDRNTPERQEARRKSARKSYENIEKTEDYYEYRRQVERRSRNKHLHSRRESGREKSYLPRRRYNKAQQSARLRDIPFSLSLEEYLGLVADNNPCHYGCGNTISGSGIGLDRVDNSKGYVFENVVPCCGVCNVIKEAFITEPEMLEVIKLLKSLRKNDSVWGGVGSPHVRKHTKKQS